MSWRIRYSSCDRLGFANVEHYITSCAWRAFDSREAAVAWVLRYLDARIVPSADMLSPTEPTAFIEEVLL